MGRDTEDIETVKNRLKIAHTELKQAVHYDYILVNDTVERAAEQLKHIIEAGRCRTETMLDFIKEVDQNA